MKNQYLRGRGAWTVCRFKGKLGEMEGLVLLRGEGRGGVDTLIHTVVLFFLSFWKDSLFSAPEARVLLLGYT